MCAYDKNDDNFEDTFRSIAREVSRSVERAMEQVDVNEIAGVIGVDPERAREWTDTASGWLRSQAERFGDEMASRARPGRPTPPPDPFRSPTPGKAHPDAARAGDDPLRSAAPHPLDLPSEEQGLALAALDSGRWTVEPGSNTLAAHGDGPRPNDAMGLLRGLRARDWISTDGEVTLVGSNALSRWLDAAGR